MSSPKRNRARVLTASGLKKLREQMRSHEVEEHAGFKYTLERLGELTGLDPETVKNVLDCKGSDKRTIARCFESFGLTLEDSDHIPASQTIPTIADPNFVGRDEAIADLNALVSHNAKVIVIQARGGVGKTTLARKYLQQAFGSFLEFPIAKETKDIASIEGLLEEKLRQLGEEPGREFWVSLDRLKRKLQAERIGILIDNLEPALDSAGKFIEAHRRYVELLRVLSDPMVKSITLITSRERLREADVTVQHYSLRSLDVQAWSQFFQSRSINIENPALAALHNAYGGNAKAMDIISGAVLEDFSGDVEAYWQANQDDLFIERDLEDLVTKQFDRLQQLDPDAYKLLCRMGCYRYQDVPTVPIDGLFCLLWDVPENRHRRVIKSLQDRSLSDFEDGFFWLHPAVREESITRLRVSEDWEVGNHKAAEFWTNSIAVVDTAKDALRAFEAYFHYLDICDYEKAGNVVAFGRYSNRSQKIQSLGSSLIKFGVWQTLIFEIKRIVNYISPSYCLSNLYRILSSAYLLTGNTKEAIQCSERSGDIAKVCLSGLDTDIGKSKTDSKLRILYKISLMNISLCKILLWELEEAERITKKLLEDKENNRPLYEWSVLAFLHSCSDRENEAIFFADKAHSLLSDQTQAFDIWNLSYGAIFLGLAYKNVKDFKKASEVYHQAIAFTEQTTYFNHVKAKALAGLAEIHRESQEFEIVLLYLSQAIRILEFVGAKPELAEAHYQFGLTYQAMQETKESDENFQKAIRLFSEMEAPKQVERVRKSMQSSQ
ncbi:MAG: ATP-binding protein [Lyngbya sp. HA4199-MV5]|jgi:tetratricopeptide (TPR) repeat protein|nr:ATP-binding protein [Lyngbya sp. HA4199-MV5]